MNCQNGFQMKTTVGLPFWFFIASGLAALSIPIAAFSILPAAGVLIGIIAPILWLTQMPTGCMRGTLIAFPLAIIQVSSGFAWLVVGVGLLARAIAR